MSEKLNIYINRLFPT